MPCICALGQLLQVTYNDPSDRLAIGQGYGRANWRQNLSER